MRTPRAMASVRFWLELRARLRNPTQKLGKQAPTGTCLILLKDYNSLYRRLNCFHALINRVAPMPRLKANESVCSIARSLELVGDRWSLLLIREVLFGTHRFDEFTSHLGISRNVLTQALRRLTDGGILAQKPLKQDTRRQGYYLTEKGEGLLPVLVAILQWGDQWLQTPDSVPMRVIERATGESLAPLRLRSRKGRELARRDLDWAPGPGALHPSVAHIAADYERQRWRPPLNVPAPQQPPIESEPTP